MPYTIAVLVGSLRSESINRRLALALEKLARGKLVFDYASLGDLPLYNDDLWQDGRAPEPVMRLKDVIGQADGVLFVTPEYNRTVPGLLVNACDWASRPYGQSSFEGKPAAAIGASVGAIGTAMAQSHLRSNMLGLGLVPMGRPEAFIHWKPDHYAEDGSISDEATKAFLQSFVDSLAAHVERLS
ncbi:NADPH-dependent FMN reductase [Paracoccus contaminans]|uniref:NADPH-dependent FMN reductase n=1 Tax=Paracoccus contaminans TaxID=1945662 RepID=A0A1W6CUI6_9RHOB|nr:NADPH-dependent FMN reductase [Paracoccus contaminans]ARJ68527.1 NADPH-dependent FMN reductase [Paracoccus contaminans]